MLIALPSAAFILTLLALRLRLSDRSWREAFLGAAVVLGSLTVLVTEGLSLFHLIRFPAIVGFWVTVTAASAIFYYVTAHRTPQGAARLRPYVGKFGVSYALFGGVALLVAAIAVVALVAPPNTWDSMEYHMAKVMHWIQNSSVAFYPTAVPRQNHLAPGTEFAILHLQLLSGSDRFANLAEWSAMVGSLVGVSLIARQLGAHALGQLLAAVFALTLPMGILQASSSQTDYVVAFWFVCFVHYLLRWMKPSVGPDLASGPGTPSDAIGWPAVFGLSASLGLAAFTKATVYLFAPAFLLWMALAQIRRLRWRVLAPFGVIAGLFFCLNAGPYLRNWQVYGHPLGPREEPEPNTKYSLDSHAPAALASNLAKNIATHFNTPWPSINTAIQDGYVALHQKLGWDINDPRTSWRVPGPRFSIRRMAYNDEADGNPIHLLLAVVCGGIVLAVPALRRERTLLMYGGATVVGFLLFAFYLKWHPWMSRLHLGLFVTAAPLFGVVATRWYAKWVAAIVGGLLLLLAVPWVLYCRQRPVVAPENIFNTSRERLYFKAPGQKFEPAFMAGRDFLRAHNVSQVGLIMGNSSWEYPWWILLRRDDRPIRIEHVNVTDPSKSLYALPRFRDFQPEAVLTIDQRGQPGTITIGSSNYTRRWAQDRVAIYLRD